MNILSMILAILAGIFTTIESSINAQLGKYITPSLATFHSLLIGTVMMFFICLYNNSIREYSHIMKLPPILWIGGLFGAFIILFSSISMPDLGISNTLILILSGQLISSLVMDVYMNGAVIETKKTIGLALFLIGTIIFLKE